LLYKQNRLKQKSNDVITQKNHQLQHLVTEKEWLLKEVHHRVKNNLQVMMSLQELQVRNLTSTEALTAVHDSSNRLYAMSLIHQKLYQQDGLARIDMRQYIGELVRYLTDAFSPGKTVKVETDLQSDIELSVSQAIPVGLILNEAITNTFKYAFANRSAGEADPRLRIGLCRKGQGGEIELLIADNGRGYDAKQDKTRKKSLGFSLMEALADELDGELSIVNENGVTLILRFIPIEAGRILRFAPALA
jgi:two-component sensor histidine kinase